MVVILTFFFISSFYNLPMGYHLFLFYHTYIISLSSKTFFKIYNNLNVVLLLLIASMRLLLPSPNPHIHKQEKCSLNSCRHGYVLQGLYILGCTIDDCCIIILFQLQQNIKYLLLIILSHLACMDIQIHILFVEGSLNIFSFDTCML